MSPEQQSDLLVRVDQNVINLCKLFDQHVKEDKEYQDVTNARIHTAENILAERRGTIRVAEAIWAFVIGVGGAILGAKYGSR